MENVFFVEGYQISNLLYESKKSKIFRAVHIGSGESVIIKLLNKTYPSSEELSKFRKEYEINKIVNFNGRCELKEHKNSLLIIMDYFDGNSLRNIINSKKITFKEFLLIAIKITDILGEIHNKNIIHKDINPANILWDKNNKLKIIDFGISIQLSYEIAEILSPEQLEGTLNYISPEQTGRMNRPIDYRTDLYSLGVLFYEILSGKLPFYGKDSMELLHSHIAKKPLSPSKINLKIPETLSKIILKLLSKNAEKRYQSLVCLKFDLEKCMFQLNKNNKIESFEIATKDFSDKFKIPQKLYGREEELNILIDNFNKISEKSKLLLVTGRSGVGKSSLVNEILKLIINKKGYFIKGKFDQFQKDIPYNAISQAFENLIKEFLSEPKEKLDRWRKKILNSFSNNGQIIIDIIPKIEQIVGKQEKVEELNPTESQNRFLMIFRNFVKVIARKEHPLVIFLDDLQWSDQASLNLIKDLMTKDVPHFMLILAYRDNEVKEGDPFDLMLNEISKTKVFNKIKLETLKKNAVSQLISETTNYSPEKVKDLSDIVFQKTKGNPFFINEFLKNLYKEKFFKFNKNTGKWDWKLNEIKEIKISDNVVEFMLTKIKKLPDDCLSVLKVASCIGNRFNIKTLSFILKKEITEVVNSLWKALEEEIIFSKGNLNKIIYSDVNEKFNIFYEFQHDRIQQAAYALIDNDKKKETHLKIGKLILKNINEENKEEHLIEIVNHFNIGRTLIESDEEKKQLTLLNYQAGNKAQLSSAYLIAFNFFEIAISLLHESTWIDNYQFTFNLYKSYSQCAYQVFKYKEAKEAIDILLKNSKSKYEKADIISILVRQYTTISKPREAVKEGIKGLALLGIKISEKVGMISILKEIIIAKIRLRKHKEIKDLIGLPILEDKEKQAATRLISDMSGTAYTLGNENLFGLLNLKVVNISLKYGNSPESSYAYIAYGMLLSIAFGDYKSSFELGKLALAVNEKLRNSEYKCRVIAAYCALTQHLNFHWSTLTKWLKKGIEAGFMSGDIFYLAYCAGTYLTFNPKIHLKSLIERQTKYMSIVHDTNYKDAKYTYIFFLQKYRNFMGETKEQFSLNDENFDGENILKGMQERNYIIGTAVYFFNKADIYLFYEEYEKAYHYVKKTDKIKKAFIGLLYVVMFSKIAFYTASALISNLSKHSISKKELLKRMKEEYKNMEKLANYNPKNYFHIFKLMEAEMEKYKGNIKEALICYEMSIKNAHQNEWYRDTAFANELTAKFYLEIRQEKAAEAYMKEANYHYEKWGANAKNKFLEKKYPNFLLKISNEQLREKTDNANKTTTTATVVSSLEKGGSSLDLLSIVKSSQTISGEIVLDILMEKLMKIVIENAGAQKGLLFLMVDKELKLQAKINIEKKENFALQNIPISKYNDISKSIINYVVNSKSSIVLSNAVNEGQFTQDEYIIKNQLLSVLVMPIIKQNNLYGVLYLENNLTTGAFTRERQEVLNMLSGQIAVSIENALLYENLENKVNQRTKALSLANSKLQIIFKQVSKQKEKIEISHKHIKDSINYAKKIQDAILPSLDLFKNNLSDYFIMFKPLDVVSGDFYWAKKVKENFIFVAADCTGHGVPGAFVSMLGISFLNEIVAKKEINQAGKTLDILREEIKKSLNQNSESKRQEGMDIAFCSLNTKTNFLQFAGANNSLYLFRNNEMIEYKADRQPIGVYRKEKSFTNHEIQLEKEDKLYIFSDGFIDQFGGEKNKKFMKKNFKKLLSEIQNENMNKQKEILEYEFKKWKGQVKQIDDVLVMGMKI